ncbi:hypothetical protein CAUPRSCDRAFT_11306 [Caulochytrium protostelioides]|uniref:Uncharacterized protein n=1 Tax=Caulochytrium protostelioides TaxID=1555241 RepID=A0A4P9WUG2_9FUNG|nr:hypothetical protein CAUPRSCDRAFT_11306 [Caulochytrium protostelioides]
MASQPPPDYRSYYADAAGSTAPPPTATQAAVQPAAPAAPVADGPAAVPPQSPGSAALASTGGPAPAVAGYYDRPAVFSHTATGAAARASGMHPPSQYPGHPSDYSHASAPAAHPHHAAPHPAHPHTAPPPHVHHGYDERERERDPYAAHPQVAAHAHAYPPPQPASHDGYAHPHHAPPHDPYHPGYTYSHPPPQQQQQQLQPPPPHRGGEYSHASHAMPAPASLRGGYDAASRYAPHPAAYPDPYADARSAQGYGHHAPPHAHHAAPESYASHGAQAEHVPRDPYARHADPYAGGYPHDPYRHDAYHAAAAPLRGSSTVHPDVANGYASHHAASRHAPQVYPPHAHPHGHAYADYGRHAAPSSAGPHGAPSGPHEYLHPSMPHLTSPSSHYAPSSHTPVGPSGAVAPASASAATPASASTITSAPTEVIDLEHRPISPETVPRSATNATSPNHDLNAGLSIANLVHDPASAGKRPSPAPTMTPEHAADGVSAAASALPHHQPAKPPPPSHEPPHHPPPYGSLSHPDHAHHLYSHGHHHHPSAHAHTHAHADPHSFPAVADVASTRLNPQPSTATETDPSIGPVAHALALPRRRGHRANSLHKAPAGSVPHEPADYHHHHLTTVSTAGPTPTNGAAPSDLSSATASATVSGATSPTSRRGPGRATGTTRKYHADPEAGTRKTSTAYFEPPVVRRRGRPPKSNPASGSESGTATRPRRASPASSTGRRGAQGMHDASPMLRKGASANPAVSLADATMMLEALEAGSSSTTKAVEAPVAPALAAPTAVLAATPLSATARAPGRGEPEPPSPFSSPDLVSD